MKVKPTLIWPRGAKVIGNVTTPRGDGRVVLETAWLRPMDQDGKWWLQATNSYVFLGLQVNVENERKLRERATAGDAIAIPIPPKAILALERSPAVAAAYFEEDGSVTVDDVTYRQPQSWPGGKGEDGFPEVPGQFPDMEKLEPEQKDGNVYEIGVDADLLLKLARSMGSKKVRLKFDTTKNLSPFWVEPLGVESENTKGFQMPIRLNV